MGAAGMGAAPSCKKALCKVVVSNRFERLAEALGEHLFTGALFAQRVVLVPGASLKNRLLDALAKDPKWGIAAGMRFDSIEGFLSFSLEKTQEKKRLPSRWELSLLLEEEIACMEEKEREHPLLGYLNAMPQKKEGRIRSVARHLSALFLSYGLYGKGFLEEWLQKEGWKQELWKKIFRDRWTFPLESFQDLVLPPVHLFGFFSLPSLYRELFKKSASIFYLLSPSPFFLGDLLSDRETLYVEKRGRERKVSFPERREVEHYLKQPNRFLANFGKERRKLLSLLEDEEALVEERYAEPPEPQTLLKRVQADFYHLRNPEQELHGSLFDPTIQLHRAPSRYREVEILKENLLSFAKKGVALKEMAVLAPDLKSYLPYIEAVLGARENPLPFALFECKKRDAFSFAQGFLHLLSLRGSRFEKEEVLKLFSFPSFRKGCNMDPSDAECFCSWMRKSALLWGFDRTHRERILKGEEGSFLVRTGTWEWSFERLLFGLATLERTPFYFSLDLAPLPLVSLTEAELLGKGIDAIQRIYKATLEMEEKKLGFSEWVRFFSEMAGNFFLIKEEEKRFFLELERIGRKLFSSSSLDRKKVTAERMGCILKEFFQQKEESPISSNREVVSFHPLKEGSVPSVSVLFLLGMQEGAFPRTERKNPFLDPGFDIPSNLDEERNLFLEVLLLAKESLVISCSTSSDEEGGELMPSLFVQELFSHVEKGGEERERAIDSLFFQHPLFSFDASYFDEKSSFRSLSLSHFAAAKSYYLTPLREESSLFDQSEEEKKEQGDRRVSVQQLLKLARHPIQFFFNETLGIYFEKEEQEIREFTLSSYDKARLSRLDPCLPFDELVMQAEAKGELPLWHFREVAKAALEEEREVYKRGLEACGVDLKGLLTILLREDLQEPLEPLAGTLHLPALEAAMPDGRRVKIVGTLRGISLQGLLFHGRDKIEDLVKAWPAFLVFQCLSHPALEEKKLLLTKAGKVKSLSIQDPLLALGRYLSYLEESERRMSPFLPRFAEAFLRKDGADLQKRLASLEKEIAISGSDPYLEWLFAREKKRDAEGMISRWSLLLCEAMDVLL
ncbi:MAG: hypothetical protein A3E26_03380 [Chlamydiae bacterium RIFCSPHIGHO2_12_FULL_49_32]|nr:MAG: hypothetical protein A3E26_03380 [Chlamydiae bacterium RIFCSPHIGHO2_12_FULL_49_32]